MPRQGAITCPPGRVALPTVGIPHEELPAVSLPVAAATRGKPEAIGAPGHAPDNPVMPLQPQLLRATPGVPHIDVAITAPADQLRAIRAPGHATGPGWVRTTHPPWVRLGHVPHQHALQQGSAGQKLSIGTPGDAVEDGLGVLEVPQDLDTGAGSWVPQPDGTLPPGTCEQAAIGTPPHAVHEPAMYAQHHGRCSNVLHVWAHSVYGALLTILL